MEGGREIGNVVVHMYYVCECVCVLLFFFVKETAPTEIYTE